LILNHGRRLDFRPVTDIASPRIKIHRLDTCCWLVVSIVGILVLFAIVGAPLALGTGNATIAQDIYKGFSFVCHQIPERSFHLYGNKFAVCSRCTGIYAGLALATLAYPLARSLKRTEPPRLVWLFLAAAPLAIDWSLGYFSIWQNNHVSRFATGFLLGAVVVFYILPGLIELSRRIFSRLLRKFPLPVGEG
jgi:uncharacterized membrane protein